MPRFIVATLFLALLGATSHAQEEGQPPRVLAWNDLGMHCMDPDFSVFTILPPYNTVHAQVMRQGQVITAQQVLAVTYEASADATGSINTTSIGKTDFWDHVGALFGATPPVDAGLAGFDMPGPGNTPQSMLFDPEYRWLTGEGIPITPIDDAGAHNNYPMMRVRVRDGAGQQLATTRTVLPVSTELECSMCHASDASPFAKPAAGWVHDADPLRDDRWNILRLHDERHLGEPLHDAALATLGYAPTGLEATAAGGTPILCASCHGSNALPGTGQPGISALTAAIHTRHGPVLAANGVSIDDDATRNGCFSCHPGQVTQCLRGAMGKAVASNGDLAMSCASCHGTASDVGDPARVGWLEEPSCQQCHTGTATQNSGAIRFTSVFAAPGVPHTAADPIFATNADTPAAGFDLYRFSEGHGGLQCAACHGSPHAIYPASSPNDNVQSMEFQGHVGTIVECTACHTNDTLETFLTGPHGMHPVGLKWAKSDHGDAAEQLGLASCRECHGADLRGTELSRAHADRSYAIGEGFGTKTFFRGAEVSCYVCHNGPGNDHPSGNAPPVVADLALSTPADQSALTLLSAVDPNGNPLTLRIVEQPQFGRVGLTGGAATYYPNGDHVGADTFTYAAYDNASSSNLGTVSVDVTAPVCGTLAPYGFGCPGGDGALPVLSVSGCAQSGGTLQFDITGGAGGADAFVLLGAGQGVLAKPNGCVIRVLPLLPKVLRFKLGGDGTAHVPLSVPDDLSGSTLTLQVFLRDAGASGGFASTNALELVFP